jgi:hypothetical protein
MTKPKNAWIERLKKMGVSVKIKPKSQWEHEQEKSATNQEITKFVSRYSWKGVSDKHLEDLAEDDFFTIAWASFPNWNQNSMQRLAYALEFSVDREKIDRGLVDTEE